jgi:hypothetical protein
LVTTRERAAAAETARPMEAGWVQRKAAAAATARPREAGWVQRKAAEETARAAMVRAREMAAPWATA